MDTTNLVEISRLIAASKEPSIPIAIQVTGLIVSALTPLLLVVVLWIQTKIKAMTDATHVIVNSQRTEMMASIAKLQDESRISSAVAAAAVAEKRMAEMNAANQLAMKDAIIEAAKLSKTL